MSLITANGRTITLCLTACLEFHIDYVRYTSFKISQRVIKNLSNDFIFGKVFEIPIKNFQILKKILIIK